MQAQTRTTASASSRPSRLISSYTCPRCRQYGRGARCTRCGWSPSSQTPLASSTGHEDRIIAC